MENVESFRNFLLGSFPKLKLPKGKKVVELSLGKGILMCCMVRKDGVMVFLYSGGRIPADEIFSKLNSLGVTGKVINNKYKIDPLPGSRNPNIVRIDLLVPFENRDLKNQDLRNEVLDVYNQLIDLCMPLNPDAVVQKETEDYEDKTKLIEQAKTITETNNGEIDDFLEDENISKDLLEMLYDLNIKNWVENRDDFENSWSLDLIVKNSQSSSSLLKKVFKHLENNLYDDKEVQFSDLAKNIYTKLGDEDWAKKLYQIVEEIVFSDGYIEKKGISKASDLAVNITTSLKDRSWGRILFEKIEKLENINKVAFATNLAKSFNDDTEWCKRIYHSVLNNEENAQSSKDLILLAHTIASHDKTNRHMSIEMFNKAEKLAIYLSDYIKLAGSVSIEDGLNDSEWGENLFQKGLQQFSSIDYVEHPKVKEWELQNEVSKIIGQINNDYNFPWETMKNWLKPLEDINNKLASGNSKIDAVKDYLPSSESSETETGEKNKKFLSGKLNIIIEGKMSQCRIGKISHEMKNALKIASENYIDEVSNESELLEMMIRGDFEEISNSIPQSALDSDCKELNKLLGKDRGEIFEELNIFYEPFVIDDDNKILIKIGDHIVYEGLISQLGEERFELGYDKEKVESEFKLKISEILKKISFTTIQSETDQLCWSDDISFENQESIIQSFEDGENLSKYGWWLYCINNSKYEHEKNSDNWDNRVFITEYGSFKLEFQPIQVENFDWLKLIWRVDGDIEEADLTGSEYMLSNILYVDDKKGIFELEPSIREFDLKDVNCGFHWPGT